MTPTHENKVQNGTGDQNSKQFSQLTKENFPHQKSKKAVVIETANTKCGKNFHILLEIVNMYYTKSLLK